MAVKGVRLGSRRERRSLRAAAVLIVLGGAVTVSGIAGAHPAWASCGTSVSWTGNGDGNSWEMPTIGLPAYPRPVTA